MCSLKLVYNDTVFDHIDNFTESVQISPSLIPHSDISTVFLPYVVYMSLTTNLVVFTGSHIRFAVTKLNIIFDRFDNFPTYGRAIYHVNIYEMYCHCTAWQKKLIRQTTNIVWTSFMKPHRALRTLCLLHFQKIAFFGCVPRFTANTENLSAGNVNYKFLVLTVWYWALWNTVLRAQTDKRLCGAINKHRPIHTQVWSMCVNRPTLIFIALQNRSSVWALIVND